MLIAAYLAWGVGVNTVGTVLGIVLGSGVMKLRNAAILAAGCTALGAFFLSERIMITMGESIAHIDLLGVLVIFVTTGMIITFTMYTRIPIFVTYLFIGAIAGYSLVKGIAVDMLIFKEILLSLLISPLAAITLGYLVYTLLRKFKLNKIQSAPAREAFERKFAVPAVIGLMLLSFALGGNSVGVSVGVLKGFVAVNWLKLLGAGGVLLGILTWSWKIATTVGTKFTDLSPTRGFSVQIAAALTIFTFIGLSIPVSTTQTLIGAIVGVGLARGRLEPGTLRNVAFSWIFGLPAAIGIAALIAYII